MHHLTGELGSVQEHILQMVMQRLKDFNLDLSTKHPKESHKIQLKILASESVHQWSSCFPNAFDSHLSS